MKQIFLIILFFISASFIKAQSLDEQINKGIKEIYNIKFEDAERTFRVVMADHPELPSGRFFLAMVDWWRILVDLDNAYNDDRFFQKLEDVIFQCDEILKKNPNDVDALFFKGGAIGFRGRLRAIRDSWIKAADDGRVALPIVEYAAQLDPGNYDVQLGFGIYNYYAAVIPDRYPAVKPLMLFFPSGDKMKGIEQLNLTAEKGRYAKYEALYFLMTNYYTFENDAYNAEKYAKILTDEFPDNPVFQRWAGRIAAKQGNIFKSAQIFTDVYNKAVKNMPGYNFDKLKREATYYIGLEYKNENKADSAIYYLEKCMEFSKRVDVKEASGFQSNASLYLGMMHDLKGEREIAIRYYNETLELKDFGSSHDYANMYLQNPYK